MLTARAALVEINDVTACILSIMIVSFAIPVAAMDCMRFFDLMVCVASGATKPETVVIDASDSAFSR